jgi:hypothetical protein
MFEGHNYCSSHVNEQQLHMQLRSTQLNQNQDHDVSYLLGKGMLASRNS